MTSAGRVWTAAVSLLILSLGGLVACGGKDAAANSPYSAAMKEVAQRTKYPFERQVLEDGKVTRAEYVDAVQRYVQCAAQHGIALTTHDANGLFNYESDRLPKQKLDELDQCSFGTTYQIEGFYGEEITNPRDEDPYDLRAHCLVASGLAAKGFTGSDLRRDMPNDGEAHFPFSSGDPRFNDCMNNPQTHQ